MKVYEFTYVLVGIGDDEDDALADALEDFMEDPHLPSRSILLNPGEDDDDL